MTPAVADTSETRNAATAASRCVSKPGIAIQHPGRSMQQDYGYVKHHPLREAYHHYRGLGNNQMLVGDPETGEIQRFLVGPKGCEVTGLTFSTDRKTLFVGIQHPGQKGGSHFPDGGRSVPRSCVIAIR